MKTIFQCLYGSRLYGTATPESDVDWKRIVLPTLDSLLLGKSPKNSVSTPSKTVGQKNSASDQDIEQIPLQVFARHFLEGQTYALELAHAVECTGAEQVIFDSRFVDFCRELRSKFLTSDCSAMVGYAVNQANLYSNKGERLTTAKKALDLYSKFAQQFGMNAKPQDCMEQFDAAAKELASEHPLYFELTEYATDADGQVLRSCVVLLKKTLPHSTSFAITVKTIDSILKKYGSRALVASEDFVDWKATMHAIRIINEGRDLLAGKGLSFPYYPDYAEWLLSIKRGELAKQEVLEQIETGIGLLKQASADSTLPAHSPELINEFNQWLVGWLRKFYDLEAV